MIRGETSESDPIDPAIDLGVVQARGQPCVHQRRHLGQAQRQDAVIHRRAVTRPGLAHRLCTASQFATSISHQRLHC